ncbi:putative transcription factor interactor and regulator CCHC(Zn) family [Helianthus annuus]|nr:putative transcription factor interactor and regulator CCHC(Zn) family [Helianthus annuus]
MHFKAFMECKPHPFNGTEGAVSLLHWIKKVESVFEICDCPANSRVKFATATFEGNTLSWWNAQIQMLGLADANATSWNDFKDLIREEYCHRDNIQKLEVEYYGLNMVISEIKAYIKRSNDLAALCPNLSQPVYKLIELYLRGLVPEIQSLVTSANLLTIQQNIRLAHRLTDQAVDQGKLPQRISTTTDTSGDNKRKWDNNKCSKSSQPQAQQRKIEGNKGPNQQTGGYLGNCPKCNKCNRYHNRQCEKNHCQRCNKLGHEAKDCRSPYPAKQNQKAPQQQQPQQGNVRGCFQCGDEGHIK